MSGLAAGELSFLFTANTTQVEQAETRVRQVGQRIESRPARVRVTADATDALAGMDRVEDAARRIVSQDVVARVEADISQAMSEAQTIQGDLERLRSMETTVEVSADIARAEDRLIQVGRTLNGLDAERASMVVDADTSRAEAALGDLSDSAGEAGVEGGEAAGEGLSAGVLTALLSIPVAGAIIGVGAAIGKALAEGVEDGLQVEVRQDRLQALTGMSEEEAKRLARSAGEAYANVFGESIEANMDTARIAVQSGILDPAATQRDSQAVIQSLSGIADVLGEDVLPISQAVTTMLRTGIVKSADEAFDVIAAGARNGVNLHEDLLDTLIEYPALFAKLGLSGEESMGLINQGLEGGARNADLVADALKEFQIRATDASETSAAGFEAIGLNAEEMTAKIAAGGEGAKAGLDQVLDGLNAMEDPVARNAAGVALFGTQWEDMGAAMQSLDVTSAVASLGQIEGAAKTMFDTIAGNDATKIQQAGRNVEVAMDGIKGALAAGFGEPLGELADWISSNRGPLTQFLLDMAVGAIDLGISFVNGLAGATEAVGTFVAGPLAEIVDGVAAVLNGLDNIPGIDTGDAEKSMRDLAESMRGADESAAAAAETMRTTLIDEGLTPARDAVVAFGDGVVAMGYLNDASLVLAGTVAQLGYDAEGAALSLEGLDVTNLSASTSGSQLEEQLLAASAALEAETVAAAVAGEGQAELTTRYNAGRDALMTQLQAMGLTAEQAQTLTDKYLAIPGSADTVVSSNASQKSVEVDDLSVKISALPDGSFTVTANTETAYSKITALQTAIRAATGDRSFRIATGFGGSGGQVMHEGGVLEFMAQGGLTPMSPVAQMVPPNTWRVVGDRAVDDEAYIPLDGSARSHAILAEAMRRMGVSPMAAGGFVGAVPAAGGSPSVDLAAALAGLTVVVQADIGIDRRTAARIVQVGAQEGGRL